MGAQPGFADVLCAKLADVPPPVAPGGPSAPRIASPGWVHGLEPLRVVSARVLHQRYPQPASAAPAAGGIPVEAARASRRSGSQVTSLPRSPRERLAIQLLTRLGADIPASPTDEDIRRAYLAVVRESHPDRHQGATPADLETHARRLRAAIHAWHVFQGRAAQAA